MELGPHSREWLSVNLERLIANEKERLSLITEVDLITRELRELTFDDVKPKVIEKGRYVGFPAHVIKLMCDISYRNDKDRHVADEAITKLRQIIKTGNMETEKVALVLPGLEPDLTLPGL